MVWYGEFTTGELNLIIDPESYTESSLLEIPLIGFWVLMFASAGGGQILEPSDVKLLSGLPGHYKDGRSPYLVIETHRLYLRLSTR